MTARTGARAALVKVASRCGNICRAAAKWQPRDYFDKVYVVADLLAFTPLFPDDQYRFRSCA
jgi:hypothetical protein